MKLRTKLILDAEASKERTLTIYVLLGALLLCFIFVAAGIPIKSNTVQGTIISINLKETDEGSKPIIRARLESGQIIVAGYPPTLQFEKDKKAEFVKRRSLLGQTAYSFNRYIE